MFQRPLDADEQCFVMSLLILSVMVLQWMFCKLIYEPLKLRKINQLAPPELTSEETNQVQDGLDELSFVAHKAQLEEEYEPPPHRKKLMMEATSYLWDRQSHEERVQEFKWDKERSSENFSSMFEWTVPIVVLIFLSNVAKYFDLLP